MRYRSAGFGQGYFVDGETGVAVHTTLFSDSGGLGYLNLAKPEVIEPVEITGVVHKGMGELADWERVYQDRYLVAYNIDGVSWGYEGILRGKHLAFDRVVWGQGRLAGASSTDTTVTWPGPPSSPPPSQRPLCTVVLLGPVAQPAFRDR